MSAIRQIEIWNVKKLSRIYSSFQVDVSHFLTPSFHPSFVGVLKILEQQETEVKQERAFKKFVRDYGTHYLSSAFLGAKLSALTHYSSYEKLKLGKQNLLECSSMQAFNQFKLENEHIEDKEDELKKLLNLTQCWSDGDGDHFNGKSRTKMVNYGTKPGNTKLSKWINEEIRPIPIKIELTPIVNLFNAEALDERYNVSSSKILDWFLPLYLKYCKVRFSRIQYFEFPAIFSRAFRFVKKVNKPEKLAKNETF